MVHPSSLQQTNDPSQFIRNAAIFFVNFGKVWQPSSFRSSLRSGWASVTIKSENWYQGKVQKRDFPVEWRILLVFVKTVFVKIGPWRKQEDVEWLMDDAVVIWVVQKN